MKSINKLIISAAGSGKTTFLVENALNNKKGKILITTYTEANEAEIRSKFISINKCIPKNVTIQTWFSFLIQHGIKPFQGHFDNLLFDYQIKGLLLTNVKSAVKFYNKSGIPICHKEDDTIKHYFSSEHKIYSDKLSKFAVGGGDRFRTSPNRKQFCKLVFNRLSRIFTDIYIDEVQDLAGYDLEFLKFLFHEKINIVLVGDPRQVTYLTHNETKYNIYKDGKIEAFIKEKCAGCFNLKQIDLDSLRYSHRNNTFICQFASKLYPEYAVTEPCSCRECRKNDEKPHQGIFLIKHGDVRNYLSKYTPTQLRYDKDVQVDNEYSAINFGSSKGLTFDRVMIYPTDPFVRWIKNNEFNLKPMTRSKFYVAITRARLSVAIVCDEDINMAGLLRYTEE